MEKDQLISFLKSLDVKYIFFISILIHIALELLFPSMYGDQFMQINSFYNWLDGHGLTLNYVTPDDISKIKYETLNLWPFGFVWMIYPIFVLTKSVLVSVMFWNILFILVFFYSIKGILNLFSEYFSHNQSKVIYFFFAICIMPSRYMGSTDLWSLGLLFFCLWQFLDIVIRDDISNKSAILKTMAISCAMVLIVVLKYSYWLYILLFPGLFVVYGYLKDRKNYRLGLLSLFLTGIFSGLYIIYHYNYFGQIIPRTLPPKDSLQWTALLRYNPIFFNSLFRDSIIRNFIWKFVPGQIGALIFQMSAHIFGLVILFFLVRWFKAVKSGKSLFQFSSSKLGVFLVASLAITLVNNFTFIYTTLTSGILYYHKTQYPLGYSVVAEVRYFAPMIVLLVLFYNLINNRFFKIVLCFSIVFAFLINLMLLDSRLISERFGVQKFLHYSESADNLAKAMSRKKNLVYLRSSLSDQNDDYKIKFLNIPTICLESNVNEYVAKNIFRYVQGEKLILKSRKIIEVATLVSNNDKSFDHYNPKILFKNLKPNINLIGFKVYPAQN